MHRSLSYPVCWFDELSIWLWLGKDTHQSRTWRSRNSKAILSNHWNFSPKPIALHQHLCRFFFEWKWWDSDEWDTKYIRYRRACENSKSGASSPWKYCPFYSSLLEECLPFQIPKTSISILHIIIVHFSVRRRIFLLWNSGDSSGICNGL